MQAESSITICSGSRGREIVRSMDQIDTSNRSISNTAPQNKAPDDFDGDSLGSMSTMLVIYAVDEDSGEEFVVKVIN
jgi:hypothetical protein